MPNYRRDYSTHTWFFTVVTHGRKPLFSSQAARTCLHDALQECRSRYPFTIDAWVTLPDHLHSIWTLPEDDPDYSRRWSIIKRRFTQLYRGINESPQPYWQKRFWAHAITSERDYRHHMDYIHINPLKHGLVTQVTTWPWSSFHRYVERGVYPEDWGGNVKLPRGIGRE